VKGEPLDTYGAAHNHDTRGKSASEVEKALTTIDGKQVCPWAEREYARLLVPL
jgi:hypothetical protein